MSGALKNLGYPEHDFVSDGRHRCLRCGDSHEWTCPACGNHYADDGGRVLTINGKCECRTMPPALRERRLKTLGIR